MNQAASQLACRQELQRAAQNGKSFQAEGGWEKEVIIKKCIVSGKVALLRQTEVQLIAS